MSAAKRNLRTHRSEPGTRFMFQITLPATKIGTEAAEDALLALGALSVTLTDAADHPLLEPLPGETPLWPDLLVTGLFDEGVDTGILTAVLADRLQLPAEHIRCEALPEREWTRAWLDDFHPMHFGGRLWIVPTGFEPPDPAAVNLLLDPGLAFGTGTHPTTALCLEWLARHPPQGAQVIDYGCGSGVLTLAALKLGARSAWAVDIDPQALTATAANAEKNSIPAKDLHTAPPDGLPPMQGDLVLANILANTLIDLAPTLSALVRPGGHLLLSGILSEQAAAVGSAYAARFEMMPAVEREGWALLCGTRICG